MKSFGDKLRELMDEKEINRKQLCSLARLSPASVSEYLNGTHEPSMKKKREIAKSLGVGETYFDGTAKCSASGMSVAAAAKLMGKSTEFVKQGLRDRVFPWGYAVKTSGQWSYWINPYQFERIEGIEVPMEDEGDEMTTDNETTTKN